jgi:HAD superfamily hydrolase (TIGR01509 family)
MSGRDLMTLEKRDGRWWLVAGRRPLLGVLWLVSMIDAILFDFDGLMVDSEPHSIASWRAVLRERGAEIDAATLDQLLGLRLDETSRLLVERFSLTASPAELGKAKTDYQIAHLAGNVRAMPGLKSLLDAIDRRGLRKAIASSGMRRYLEAALQVVGLASRFSVIISGEDVARGKPAPDVFLEGARRLGCSSAACLVLEDAPNGLQAAKAAGMRVVAIPNDQSRQLDLSAADWQLPSLAAVAELLPSIL